ncbi:N-acetylneuraminate synthase family protein [Desulfovibrio sp. JC010]|uniref:N-acetylneuraminate synthase family protein n=1 Tax=Desulfovibrio sp. JC010 TaxID=2593641 RepID=UPI0013D7C2E7|nr:N-acetylneuraminate synthase family protein [Desulfovibrio sp. JC010]NDV27164.1 hypothetical protein [Desulfovibrio sp. JC010]
MKIKNKDISNKIFIIAEIGNNHEGDTDIARRLIDEAVDAGVDAVKFQTFVPDEYVSADQVDRKAMLKKFQLSYAEFSELADYATQKGVIFMSTPFDEGSANALNKFVPAFKIASCDVTFYSLLETVAKTGKPIVMSTGAASEAEVLASCKYIESCWEKEGIKNPGLALLHCVSSYPTPEDEANLKAIQTLAETGYISGYSDHTLGIDAAVLSVGLGARIIEKHFTVDKNYSDFRDHQLSADPEELKLMVRKIRSAEALLGSGEIDVADCEFANRDLIRRSAAARGDIAAGEEITADILRWVRPGTGITPAQVENILGKKAAKDLKDGELITAEDLI